MSEIRVTTLKDTSGSNSSTTAEIASGRAKAWVNFAAVGTPSIRASYNVNSITDNGEGDHTINFSSALTDGNYAFSFGTSPGNGRVPYVRTNDFNDTASLSSAVLMSSTQFRVVLCDPSGPSYINKDSSFFSAIIFR